MDLVNDTDWIDDCSEPEVEIEPETEQMHDQVLTNLRVLEWLHDLPADPKKTILTIQGSTKTASNISVTTILNPTVSLQMVLYTFQNPISIGSILSDRRGRRWIFLSGEWG